MPSFDVVSEVDRQEVRNAVDQAQREIGTRFDFKGTNSSIEQAELVLTLRSVSEDRLDGAAPGARGEARQAAGLAEGPRVRRRRGGDPGHGAPDRHDQGRHLVGQGPGDQQADQGEGPEGRLQPDPGRVGPRHEQEARRPAGRACRRSGRPTSASRSSSTTVATDRPDRRPRRRRPPRLRWPDGVRLPARPARLGVPADRPRPHVDLHAAASTSRSTAACCCRSPG